MKWSSPQFSEGEKLKFKRCVLEQYVERKYRCKNISFLETANSLLLFSGVQSFKVFPQLHLNSFAITFLRWLRPAIAASKIKKHQCICKSSPWYFTPVVAFVFLFFFFYLQQWQVSATPHFGHTHLLMRELYSASSWLKPGYLTWFWFLMNTSFTLGFSLHYSTLNWPFSAFVFCRQRRWETLFLSCRGR